MISRRSLVLLVALLLCALAGPALASFHVMQIEQVIGGVNGDQTAQAIQLRMRTGGQNFVHQGRIVVRDAAGTNPVLIVDMTTDVPNGALGDHVLVTSSAFQTYASPVQTPDFTMTNVIPASYLLAGSLTFEDDFGTVYWRLSWGGGSYTGPGTVNTINDADGNANPPCGSNLPSGGFNAQKFNNGPGASSTTNFADYSVTLSGSTWTNNHGQSETVAGGPANVGGPGEVRDIELGAPAPNPGSAVLGFTYSIAMPQAAHARVAVYRANGQRVRTLIDSELSAGRANHTWDGRDERGRQVASGAYYLRLESGDVKLTRKLMVIR